MENLLFNCSQYYDIRLLKFRFWYSILIDIAICDYITLNVPPGAFSNVPLQTWSHSVRQS